MDHILRELERQYQASGSPQDGAALLQGKIKAGQLNPAAVKLAAEMLDPASLMLVPGISPLTRPAGTTQYDALEQLLYDLFLLRHDLPYRLGLLYLEQTYPIFDADPEGQHEAFNEMTQGIYHIGDSFDDYARNLVQVYETWVNGLEDAPTPLWQAATQDIRHPHLDPFFEAGAYYEGHIQRIGDGFANACDAFHNFLQALRQSFDENYRVTPGEITHSMLNLRLSINSAIVAMEEFSGVESADDHSVKHALLHNVRQEFIPHLLG